jgi:hypothetical protein
MFCPKEADLMSKKAAIAEIVKVRDQLVIIRERLFQLTAAAAARTKEVEGLLIDCAAAGRVSSTQRTKMGTRRPARLATA